MRYCSGPASKDRFGIFANGSGIIEKAAGNVGSDIVRAFGMLSQTDFRLLPHSEKPEALIFNNNMDESVNLKESYFEVRLIFCNWTMFTATGQSEKYTRILSYPHEPEEILKEVCQAFLLAIHDEA
jgi:hypothetical protein